MRKFFLLLACLLAFTGGFALTPTEKKCEKLLLRSKACADRLQADSCIQLARTAWRIANKNKLDFWIARAEGALSNGYRLKGNHNKEVITHMNTALRIFKQLGDKKWMAQSYVHFGVFYDYDGNYDKALTYYFKAEKLWTELQDTVGLVEVYGNIGIVYEILEDSAAAIKYYRMSLNLARKGADADHVATALSNLASAYSDAGDLETTLKYMNEAVEIRKKLNDLKGLARIYNNLTSLYYDKGDIDEALRYVRMSVKYRESLPESRDLGSSYYNLAFILFEQGKFTESEVNFKKSMNIAVKFNNRLGVYNALLGLSDVYDTLGRYKEGMYYIKRFTNVQDSLFDSDRTRQTLEMKEKYETEKKEKEILLQGERIKRKDAEAKRKNTVLYTGGGILVLVVLLLVVVLRSSRQKQRINLQLNQKNSEIEAQKNIIEEKHKEITDSIHYAKRIQSALLTSDEQWKEITSDYLVWLKPKDVVSGDFFWAYLAENESKQSLAVWCTADCTGHGVPGAFMSMLGIGYLNEIVAENRITDPKEIMNQLRSRIIKALDHKVGNIQQQDGMDMSLCVWNKTTMKLSFSGANNPLWILRGGAWIELNGDKMPVGKHVNDNQSFSVHEVHIHEGDRIYTFSDGFADQFGGPKGKKYKYSKLKELLAFTGNEKLAKQKQLLEDEFERWRGDLEQVDDICIVGIGIS